MNSLQSTKRATNSELDVAGFNSETRLHGRKVTVQEDRQNRDDYNIRQIRKT
jgi:hypothetical protein